MDTLSLKPHQLERYQFVRYRTAYTFNRFVQLPHDSNLRILDFGCGEGYSIDALIDLFPNSHFVGADISSSQLSTFIAQFENHPQVTLVQMTTPLATESVGHDFDVIQLNAVFEHLLPNEKKELLPDLWRRLRVNGYLVVTETPWRWFPIETHTTSLPLVNYMPDWLTLLAVRHCGRYPKSLTWDEALRHGARGATVAEIISCLRAPDAAIRRIHSSAADARDMLEVWWQGDSRRTRQKALAYGALRKLQQLTGIVISPWVNFVLQKVA